MQSFYHFHKGAQIPDYTINAWIEECISKVSSGHPHYGISSGDTCVIALKYETEIQVHVGNDSGRATIRFGHDDSLTFSPYVRAT